MATFAALALACAPAIPLDLLAAIASVESGFNPLAVVDGPRPARIETVGRAVALAVGAIDGGHEIGLGLMGIGASRLAEAGLALQDAFDACRNLAAAQRLIEQRREAAGKPGLTSSEVERLVIRAWWRPDDRYVSAASYEAAVLKERGRVATNAKINVRGAAGPDEAAAQALANSGSASPETPAVAAGTAAPTAREWRPAAPWDVFGSSRDAAVLVFGKQKGTKSE